MSTQNPSTPVTDDEQWSDETEASPQQAGYTPLDQYQALGDDEDGGEGGDQSDHEGGDAEETWREAAGDGGRSSQQHDVRRRECCVYFHRRIAVAA